MGVSGVTCGMPLLQECLYRDVVGILSIEMRVQIYIVEMSVEMTIELHSLETQVEVVIGIHFVEMYVETIVGA